MSKESIATTLFCIGEAEVEAGKLTAPQLTLKARQLVVDRVLKHLKAAKEELNEMLTTPVEEAEGENDDGVLILDGEDTKPEVRPVRSRGRG